MTAASSTEVDDVMHYIMNRTVNTAIASAFIGRGDAAVANNILESACRVQVWTVNDGGDGAQQCPDLNDR
jgi:hypothetical protein